MIHDACIKQAICPGPRRKEEGGRRKCETVFLTDACKDYRADWPTICVGHAIRSKVRKLLSPSAFRLPPLALQCGTVIAAPQADEAHPSHQLVHALFQGRFARDRAAGRV